jgi:hypothetical protein
MWSALSGPHRSLAVFRSYILQMFPTADIPDGRRATRPDRLQEISGVCTHPDFAGRVMLADSRALS